MAFSFGHGGCRLSYSLCGAGPGVLLIQGVGVHGDGWTPQTRHLQRNYSCLTFDNRGMGASQPIGPEPLTVERMADDMRAVMDHAGWTSAHLVGHSLGGSVALAFALDHPERVSSLALLCTFANGAAAAPMTLRMMWLGLRCSLGTRSMRRRGFLGLLYPPGAAELQNAASVAQSLAPVFGHDLADQPPVVRHQLAAMRNADHTPRLAELSSIRTLVVSGRHDPIAPPALGRRIAEGIAGSQFVEVADAAHGLPITHLDWVNTTLEGHFSRAGVES